LLQTNVLLVVKEVQINYLFVNFIGSHIWNIKMGHLLCSPYLYDE